MPAPGTLTKAGWAVNEPAPEVGAVCRLVEVLLSFKAVHNAMSSKAELGNDGVSEAISICALSSIEYAATFIGALRAGVAVAPLAP